MAKARSKKSNTSLFLFAAAGAAGLYFLSSKGSAKDQAIKIIAASGYVKDPSVLQTMDENYLTAWAYAIGANLPFFPALAPKSSTDTATLTIGKFDTKTGVRKTFADLLKAGQTANVLKNFTDPAQLAFANALVAATGIKGV